MSLDVFNFVNNANSFGVLAFQTFAISLVLGFTSPSSIIRPAVLPLIAVCTYSIALNARNCMRLPWAATIGAYTSCFLLMYIEMALLRGWNFESWGPNSLVLHEKAGANDAAGSKGTSTHRNRLTNPATTKVIQRETTIWDRLCFGFNSTLSFRDVNTPFEVKNVPHFSEKDPNYTPSRTQFLAWSALRFLACYLVLDIVESQQPPGNAAEMFGLNSVPIFRRLNEVSIEEVVTRTISSFVFWIMVYTVLNVQQAFFAMVAVGSGLTEVKAWRPLMGSLSETYTIRGFWGKFWHQGTRKMNTDPANFIADDILHLPKGSLIARYSKIFIVFFLSGFGHYVADFAGTESLYPFGAWVFFVSQALGIILEDAVQATYRSFFRHSSSHGQSPLWTRIVGHVWVVAFLLFWTTPAWFFPNAHVQNPDGLQELKLVPFSVVRLLRKAA